MKVNGSVYPNYKQYLQGKILVNFNIKEVVDEEGNTSYTYEQLRFNPPMSDEAIEKEVNKRKEELIPKQVSMRRARLLLIDRGLLLTVEGAIASLPEPEKTKAEIEWNTSSYVFRNKPFVLAIAHGLGWDKEYLDNLFIEAMSNQYD